MVCPSYPPQAVTCGVGDYTRRLTTELASQGATVTVLTSKGWCGGDASPPRDVAVLPILDTPGWWRVMPADVVHVQYAPDLYRARHDITLLPLRARCGSVPPVVMTFHTLLDGTLRGRARATWLLATAAGAISANEEVSGMVRRRLPRLANRLAEIPIGSNIAPVAPPPDREQMLARLALPADALLLVHFGLVYPGKGLETLLAALARVRRRQPRAHLVVIGDTRAQDRDYRGGLQDQVARLGLQAAVVWTGRMDDADASRVLSVADLFVVPFDDGASLRRGSLMAGLAHGCAVLTTRAARGGDDLTNGDPVALAPPRDAGALAERIGALLAAPDERARLARAARKLAERFAWPEIAAMTRRVYEHVRRP
jgi:glycosyltransferase involved in cell wall biosynthesis